MIHVSSRYFRVVGGLFAWLAICLSVARAEGKPLADPRPSDSRPAALAISAEQVTAFADLVGEPRALILQRFQSEPDLVSSAVAAADARLSRQRTGKIHTSIGFGLVAVGAVTGYVLIASAYDREGNGYNVAGERIGLAGVIIAATFGVGLGLGIPGIVKLVKQSEVEKAAADHYQRPRMPSPTIPNGVIYSSPPVRYAIHVPLVAFVF